MKFGHLLEFHKIPEWYTQYCVYNDHKKRIDGFKDCVKKGYARKLKGYYTINKKGQIYCIDFIKNYKDDVKNKKAGKNLNSDRDRKNTKKRKLSFDDNRSNKDQDEDGERHFKTEVELQKQRSATEIGSVDDENERANSLVDPLTGQPRSKEAEDKDRHFSIQKFDDNYLPDKLKGKEMQAVTEGK